MRVHAQSQNLIFYAALEIVSLCLKAKREGNNPISILSVMEWSQGCLEEVTAEATFFLICMDY